MVGGSVKDGFLRTLDNYLLNAVANTGHAYVVLFTLFLSGMVGMMQKSGGMNGFTRDISAYAKDSRLGQFACFCVGVCVFFDDYANCLLAGETMRPLLDILFVSREKLAFIVDATAAPIASLSPVSSWVGFEVGLIQDEINRIIEIEGTKDIGIKTSGMGVFFQSIKYRYYPINMLVLMVLLIFSQRDFGLMLIAERKVRVYKRTDGGDGMGKEGSHEGQRENQPNPDTPNRSCNMS
jgi:Na+/H+ antiporter NhaC